ncbi:hypothetical protein QA811_43630 [Streptomyces sp. B21-102]|uniref:hypothetical protein n=1 Tax=Streptomyces sp. B21-102 TaxID=3039416 RepID=UPI002FF05E77
MLRAVGSDHGGCRGAGAGAMVGWLPALAVVLAVLAAGPWWLGRRRRSKDLLKITETAGL